MHPPPPPLPTTPYALLVHPRRGCSHPHLHLAPSNFPASASSPASPPAVADASRAA
ncbi:hypothetical protein OH76DRAFT_1401768 [Lentinus brumalis]|uniref:Uncharacterized protein n=1 Tax=Lentinus brumalis TaxID=2498619 RepID=A0A371DEQ9_9APHY|nr:hypothetical protein OH76DRAFT_1401768 [Polyporus brumalis]